VSLLVLAACDPDPRSGCEKAADFAPALEVGVGEDAFAPVEEGDVLQRVWGMQGGQHVWTAIRTSGLNPGVRRLLRVVEPGPEVSLALVGDDGVTYGEGGSYLQVLRGDEEQAEITGMYLYLEQWLLEEAEPAPAAFTLEAEATDSCGTTVADSVGVRLAD
jgi:hypothetical protein